MKKVERKAKPSISAAQRLQLIGLLTLAGEHNSIISELAEASADITGEIERNGHSADVIYEARRESNHARALDVKLKYLKIRVRR